MFDIFNFIHTIYGNGFAGVIIALLAIVIYLMRKLATNHLKHIDIKLCSIITSVADLAKDVKEIKKECGPCKERIATLEGQHKRKE